MKKEHLRMSARFRGQDPTPAYIRLQNILRNQIEGGHIKPGEQIPTERKLAEEFGVSIGTMKKALLGLVQEGYLYRIQGSGTFVTGTTLRRESLRYYRLLRGFNDDQADLKVELLSIRRIKGRQPHNGYLKLAARDRLFEMERIFLLEGKPLVYTVSYLPEKMFQGLDDYPASLFEKITLYLALEDKYGVTTVYNRLLFGTTQADDKVAGILGVDPGQAVLFAEMLSFTYKDVPYEYRHSYVLGDERKVFIEI